MEKCTELVAWLKNYKGNSQHGLFLIEVKNDKYKDLEATLKANRFLQIDWVEWALGNVYSQSKDPWDKAWKTSASF